MARHEPVTPVPPVIPITHPPLLASGAAGRCSSRWQRPAKSALAAPGHVGLLLQFPDGGELKTGKGIGRLWVRVRGVAGGSQ